MLIYRYLTRRFVLFVGVISFCLAFIFNFIEFFEKLLSVKKVHIGTIVHFLCLNFAPTMFDLLPIALWLATIILLKELAQRNEWELLQILTFIPKKMATFLLMMGLMVSVTALVLHEAVVGGLALRAASFKQEELKQFKRQMVVDRWLELEHNTLCRIGHCDLDAHRAERLFVIELSPSFRVQRVIKASAVVIDEVRLSLYCPQALIFDQSQRQAQQEYLVHSPSFFSQIYLHTEAQTLLHGVNKLLGHGRYLPPAIYNDLLGEVVTRMCYYLQLLLYPLLTLFLFMLFRGQVWPWIGALAAYPLFVLSGVIGNYALKSGFYALVLLIPYLIIVILLIFGFIRLTHR